MTLARTAAQRGHGGHQNTWVEGWRYAGITLGTGIRGSRREAERINIEKDKQRKAPQRGMLTFKRQA